MFHVRGLLLWQYAQMYTHLSYSDLNPSGQANGINPAPVLVRSDTLAYVCPSSSATAHTRAEFHR